MPPDTILNTALADFTYALTAYEPDMVFWGMRILGVILFMQFGYLAVKMAMGRDFMGMIYTFFTGLLCMGAVLVLMNFSIEVGSDLVMVGQEVGTRVSGQSPATMTPSGVYNLGLRIIGSIWNARTWGMWLNPIDDVALVIIVVLTWITWACSALIYLWALIDAVWVVMIAPIALCFAPFEYTWPSMINWAAYALKTGIKVLALLLILAVGTTLAGTWAADLAGIGTAINKYRVYYATVALVESFVFFVAVWILPNKAAALIHTSMGGGGPTIGDDGAKATVAMAQHAAGATGVTGAAGGKELGQYVQQRLMR
jgi:TrbL/VirB6 plasmid conjugal transfer protein